MVIAFSGLFLVKEAFKGSALKLCIFIEASDNKGTTLFQIVASPSKSSHLQIKEKGKFIVKESWFFLVKRSKTC